MSERDQQPAGERPRITSTQLRSMREHTAKSGNSLGRLLSNLWAAIRSGLSLFIMPARSKKTFCELNGHSVMRTANGFDPYCRYCGTHIENIEELSSRR